MKDDAARREIIRSRLEGMARRAREAQAHSAEQNAEVLARCDRYIRIRGEDFRAVSLAELAPLCGFHTRQGARNLETVYRHFALPRPTMAARLELKPERSIQCWLIKTALMEGRDLRTPLGLNGAHYDDLVFALDEVSLGDKNHPPILRCDVLGVGRTGGRSFPVLIELKSRREKKTLMGQLSEFCSEIRIYRESFGALLEACTGIPVNDLNCRRIIVWPRAKKDNPTSRAHLQSLLEAGIDVVEYDPQSVRNMYRAGLHVRSYVSTVPS
jgi:hypothetical protein